MTLDFRKKNFKTYFVRVNNYKAIQIEVHPLENKDNSQVWFQDIHLQEVLTLMRDVINARVLQSYEDSTAKLPSGNEDILTGTYVKLAYCFRKKNTNQHCMMKERDADGEYYDWTSLFKEKVVVYVLSKDSRSSNTMLKLFQMVNSPIKNSQTISISNYFVKEPIESHQLKSKQEMPLTSSTNPPSEGRKMKLKRILKKGTKLKKGKKQKKDEMGYRDAEKPKDFGDDLSDLCKTDYFDSTFDSIEPMEVVKSDDVKCLAVFSDAEVTNCDIVRESCTAQEELCRHLESDPSANSLSQCYSEKTGSEKDCDELISNVSPTKSFSKYPVTCDYLMRSISKSPKFESNIVIKSQVDITESHLSLCDGAKFNNLSSPGCSKRQFQKRCKSFDKDTESCSDEMSSHTSQKPLKSVINRPRVRRRLPDFSSFSANRKSVSHIITEYMNKEKNGESNAEVMMEEDFECELLEELSNFPRIKNEHDLEVRREIRSFRKVAELNEEHLSYLVRNSEPYLRSIFQGQFVSERHSAYKSGGKARQNLNLRVHVGLFEEFQQDIVMETLIEMFCRRHNKYLDYIMKVLLPEMLIKIYMEVHETTHEEAEHAMHLALSNPGQIIQG